MKIFLELTTYIFIFYYLLGCNFIKKKANIVLASLISIVYFGLTYTVSFPFPNTFIVLIVILLLFNCSINFKVTWGIICTTLMLISFYLLYDCTYLFTYYGLKKEYSQYMNMEIFDYLNFLLIIIICLILRKSRQQRALMLHKISPKTNLLISIVCICIFFLVNALELIFTGYFTENIFYVLTIFSLLLIPLTIVTILLILKIQYKNALLRRLFQANQEMLILEKKQYKLLQNKNEALRSFRHDFNGHLLALQTYVEQNELDKLFHYINNLSALQTDFKIYSTKNIIVDAILNQIGETLPPTVTFKVSGQFSEICFIEDFDLCTLFTNLLNNAVEATEKLTADESKEIYVEIESNNDELLLRVMNTSKPYSEQELSHLTTSKKDQANHGFGLKNIRQITKKYHGDLFIEYKNGFFSTYISCKNIH